MQNADSILDNFFTNNLDKNVELDFKKKKNSENN